jgi:hypothetical protein
VASSLVFLFFWRAQQTSKKGSTLEKGYLGLGTCFCYGCTFDFPRGALLEILVISLEQESLFPEPEVANREMIEEVL